MIKLCRKTLFFLMILAAPLCVARSQTFDLLTPNGGEIFSQGDVISIVWTGIPKIRPVTLEFTSDNGATWQVITRSATGGSYLWAVPSVVGLSYKVRASAAGDDYSLLRTLTADTAVNGVHFSPDGAFLVGFTQAPGKILVWNAENGDFITAVPAHEGSIVRGDFSPDGTKFATCSLDGLVKIWNTTSWTMIRQLAPQGTKSEVYGVRFSPNGKEVLAGYVGGAIRVWSVETGKARIDTTPFVTNTRCVDYSPDGKYFATGSSDKKARIWDAQTGNLLQTLSHADQVNAVRFTPDGSKLATGIFSSGGVLFWDLKTGDTMRLRGHTNTIYSTEFDADGERFVTASGDRSARVWRVSDGALIDTLHGHTDLVSRAMFNPDGRLIATSSQDKTVKVWQAAILSDSSEATFRVTSCAAGVVKDNDPKLRGKLANPDLR